MENKEFDTIMKEITSGLSGDPKTDIAYLQEQMENYKEHEYSKEIIRACGRLLYEAMPDDMKAELADAIDKDGKGFDAALEEIRFCIYKKELDKALRLMQALVDKYEKLDMYADDEVSAYFDFSEFFEEILFKQINNPEKDVRRAQIGYSEMYLLYGSLLFELKRYDDAEEVLRKAMRWNPSSARIAFEHAETYKVRGMMDEYVNATRDIFKIAFRPADLARCYRNMGYYFVEKGEYQTAVCCEIFSLQFDKSDMVQSELYYISTQDKTVNIDPDIEMIKKCFAVIDIPFGPDDDIIGMAYQLTKIWMERKDKEGAEYFLSIILGFFENKELLDMLEEIKNMKKCGFENVFIGEGDYQGERREIVKNIWKAE